MAGSARSDRATPCGFVLRPSVVLAAPWILSCAIWFMVVLVTTRHTLPGTAERLEEGTLAGELSLAWLLVISVVNAALLIGLCADGRVAWRQPAYVRRPQLVGVLLCAVTIVLTQCCAVLAHDPFLWARFTP